MKDFNPQFLLKIEMIFLKKYHSLCSRCTCVEVMCAGKDRAPKRDMQWERKHLPKRPMKIVSQSLSNYLAVAA